MNMDFSGLQDMGFVLICVSGSDSRSPSEFLLLQNYVLAIEKDFRILCGCQLNPGLLWYSLNVYLVAALYFTLPCCCVTLW